MTIRPHDGVPANGWVWVAVRAPLASLLTHAMVVIVVGQWWLTGPALSTRPTIVMEVAAIDTPLETTADTTIQFSPTQQASSAVGGDDQERGAAPLLPAVSTPADLNIEWISSAPPFAARRSHDVRQLLKQENLWAGVAEGRGGGSAGDGDGRGPQRGEGQASDGHGDANMGANFFGINAGGKRFVFVVDSSSSMSGRRWVQACQELLRTVKTLRPEQSFYVIFFDHQTRPMFTRRVQEDLLPATPDNITKLRRWMSSINFGNATKPAGAMEIALELEPDAIFLLSDGEFRDNTRTLLRIRNQKPQSAGVMTPIHTVGFHSRAAQISLQPLAAENGGTFRFVAHPRDKRAPEPIPPPQVSQRLQVQR